jgi:DNA-binding NtrC family response regulator
MVELALRLPHSRAVHARGGGNRTKALRILIIDDDALVRQSLSAILTTLGHEIITAGTAMDGIDRAESTPVDVALVDMKMPGLDGLEAVKAIVRMEPAIPVIGMSGGSLNPDIDYAVLATKLGAKSFLRKPFTRAELVGAIGSATAA